MNDYRIYLLDEDGNHAKLEIETIDFSTVFSINDITDISKRKDTITKNIKIVGTKNNNRVLGNLANLNRNVTAGNTDLNYNFKANNQTQCQIFENNILILKGKLQVVEVNKDSSGVIEYDAVVTGELINFFNKLQETELSSLTYPADTHVLNLDTVKNSWSATGLPYIYPSIDYGVQPVQSSDFDFRNFRCGIYLKTYLDAIFNTFGYTYTSTFTTTSIFKKAFVPYPEKSFNRKVIGSFYSTSGTTQTFNINNQSNGNIVSKPIVLGSNDNNVVTYYPNKAKDWLNNSYPSYSLLRNITTDGKAIINFSATGAGQGSFEIGIYTVNASTNNRINFAEDGTVAKANYSYNNSTVTDTITLQIPLKDYPAYTEFAVVALLRQHNTSVNFTINSATLTLGSENGSNIENKVNDVINIKDSVAQNIKVYDFLKDFLKIFNLFITINPDKDKDFIIEDFDNFYFETKNPKLSALNWSKKVDNSDLKSVFNLVLPKKYVFNFKEDSDYYNQQYKSKWNATYGDAIITNSEGYSPENKVEINFSCSQIVSTSKDSKVMPHIWSGTEDKRESFKSNLRILFNNGVGSTETYKVNFDSGVLLPSNETTYQLSNHILKDANKTDIFNLQFGVPKEVMFNVGQSIFTLPNLYTVFYKNQIDELINPNFSTFECDVWLNENDISNLDFTQPIYISTEEIGDAYFKLLEVNYKSSLELSKVKLQKILL